VSIYGMALPLIFSFVTACRDCFIVTIGSEKCSIVDNPLTPFIKGESTPYPRQRGTFLSPAGGVVMNKQ